MKYVLSKLTCDQNYAIYAPAVAGSFPRVIKEVLIKGGANVANKNLVTPDGVLTEVSDEDYEALQTVYVFQQHVKGGLIKVISSSKEKEQEKAKKDMSEGDGSAPLTPKSYKKKGKKAPVSDMEG